MGLVSTFLDCSFTERNSGGLMVDIEGIVLVARWMRARGWPVRSLAALDTSIACTRRRAYHCPA